MITEMFKRACKIQTQHAVFRYLIANTQGRLDGAEKAQRHKELCDFYVAIWKGCDPDLAMRYHRDEWDAIHTATQEMTNHLDKIGMPTDHSHPKYEDIADRFFDGFHDIAMKLILAS